MPNNASAEKRVRQTTTKTMANKAYKTKFRNASKKLLKAVDAGEGKEQLDVLLTEVYSSLDKAAKKGTIHKNQASRRKARLAAKVKAAVEAK